LVVDCYFSIADLLVTHPVGDLTMSARRFWFAFLYSSFFLGFCTVEAGADGKPEPGDMEKLPPRAVARLGSLAFAHGEIINAMAISADGKTAASGGAGKFVVGENGQGRYDYDQLTIRLWEIPSGKVRRSIPVPEGPVLALGFSPDGKSLAAGAGKRIFVWDLATGKETQRIRLDEYPLLARFTLDGKHLLINLRNKEIL
jgi:WD40 repeat protein